MEVVKIFKYQDLFCEDPWNASEGRQSEFKMHWKQAKPETGARWMHFYLARIQTARLKAIENRHTQQHEVRRPHRVDSGGTRDCTLGFFELRELKPTSPDWSCGLYPVLLIATISCDRDPTDLFLPAPLPFLSHPSLGSPEGFTGARVAAGVTVRCFTQVLPEQPP